MKGSRQHTPLLNLSQMLELVARYADLNKLKVAHKDAQDMATLFQAQEGKMFGQVKANLLTDAQVTVANLQNAIMQAKAQATSDTIAAGQTLIEVETGKAVAGIPSPAAGKVTKIAVKAGDKINVGGLILSLQESGAGAPAPAPTRALQIQEALPVFGCPFCRHRSSHGGHLCRHRCSYGRHLVNCDR